MKRTLALIITSVFIITGCDNSNELEKNTSETLIDLSGAVLQGGQNHLIPDEANPNNLFNRIDSIGVYGFGTDFFLADSMKDCDLKFIVSGKMRETETVNSSIVISLLGARDTVLFWGALNAPNYIQAANQWVDFKDSLTITRDRNTGAAVRLRIFPYKTGGKGFFDVDDLIIKVIQEE